MTQRQGDKALVLVVDDEPFLRMDVADILNEEGYIVIEAANADRALEILEAHDDIRLLFTDIQMPGSLDGMQLAKRVHELQPNVRLIVTSGRVMPVDHEIPDDGTFLRKPYSREDLLQTFREQMSKYQELPPPM